MKTDHDFLIELYGFLNKRRCITMEDASLNDMVQRYQNPPLTALNRVAMQMTTHEYNTLGQLMKDIEAHLKVEDEEDEAWIEKQKRRFKHVT